MGIKSRIIKHLLNLPGWCTNRKLVVIESDDWGSIRMPSKEVYEKALKAGYPVDLNPYERYDSLASEDDIELLFDLLSKYRDINGNHPIVTANAVVANPDFKKIETDNFKNYHYELITETFQRYPKHKNNFSLWMEGKENGIFYPQYHAREHLNVSLFMQALRDKKKEALFALQNKMPGSITKGSTQTGNNYVEATLYNSHQDKDEKLQIYLEGLDLFEQLFGYKSLSIIPTNYTWNREFDKELYAKGVRYIQGIRKMKEPIPNDEAIYFPRKQGEVNSAGLFNLVRNVAFEPTVMQHHNQVDRTLMEIAAAFRMRKPAVITSHRINYVGFLDESNRDKNLKMLDEIIKKALKKWSDIEFVSSDMLGKIIRKTNSIGYVFLK